MHNSGILLWYKPLSARFTWLSLWGTELEKGKDLIRESKSIPLSRTWLCHGKYSILKAQLLLGFQEGFLHYFSVGFTPAFILVSSDLPFLNCLPLSREQLRGPRPVPLLVGSTVSTSPGGDCSFYEGL